MSTIHYLITGANRGIGRGLLTAFLSRPNTLIVAGVRDPSHFTSKSLSSLPKGLGSSILVVKIDSASENDPMTAVEMLQSHNINKLDVVISSAGIVKLGPLHAVPIAEFREHLDINSIAVLTLFQATYQLLKKSLMPRFIVIGASAGSMGMIESYPYPNGSYSASKATVNSLVRKMHFENDWLIAFPIHPGWVQTDMGNDGARAVGMDKAAVTLEDSIAGVTKAIDVSTRETASGPFRDFEGNEIPW